MVEVAVVGGGLFCPDRVRYEGDVKEKRRDEALIAE